MPLPAALVFFLFSFLLRGKLTHVEIDKLVEGRRKELKGSKKERGGGEAKARGGEKRRRGKKPPPFPLFPLSLSFSPYPPLFLSRAHSLVRRALGLLLSADLKVFAPLDRVHVHGLAHLALQAQHDLLRRLGLFVEDGLGLAAEPGLLPVVAPLSLGVERGLAGLVLGDLVHLVLAAGLALAEGALGLGDVDLRRCGEEEEREERGEVA